jgi:hypothetical protein
VDGFWEPLDRPQAGPETWKFKFYPGSALLESEARPDPRPGMLFQEPCSWQSDEPNLLSEAGTAIYIPATSKTRNKAGEEVARRSELILEYRKTDRFKTRYPRGRFCFSKLWSLRTISDEEGCSHLVEGPTTDARRARMVSAYKGITQEPLAEAGRALLDVLGLEGPTLRPVRPPIFRQRELVLVDYHLDGSPPTPSLVISSDEYNSHPVNAITVLQCLHYSTQHDAIGSPIVPLGPVSVFAPQQWSVSVLHVRGINLWRDLDHAPLPLRAHPNRPRVRDDIWRRVTGLLRDFYA